jgi:hypothetical protein
MAASLKGKRTPITTAPYQVPNVDITADPPIFSLVTTFKPTQKKRESGRYNLASANFVVSENFRQMNELDPP